MTKKISNSLLCELETIYRLIHPLESCKGHLLLIFMLDSFKARVHYSEYLAVIFSHPMAFKIREFWPDRSEKVMEISILGNFQAALFPFIEKEYLSWRDC